FLDTTNSNYVLGSAPLAAAGSNGISFLYSYTYPTPRSNPAYAVFPLVVVADFNNDGIPDIAVAALSGNAVDNVFLLLGRGDGTFSSSAIASNVHLSAIAAGAFNHYGNAGLSLFSLSPSGSATIQVLAGSGNGTFASGPIASVPEGCSLPVVDDFDHDGNLDIACITAEV